MSCGYKKLIIKKIELQKNNSEGFRQTTLSKTLGIEPSYLSRFLSDSKIHFSNELLIKLLIALKFTQEEIDWLLAQRLT